MSCMLMGDSLAVGVGQFRPDCEVVAKVGITSERYIASYLPSGAVLADTVVISLGVNDDETLDTFDNLQEVRSRVRAAAVYWLLPGLKEQVRSMILRVARQYGDQVVDTRPQAGRDHLHPTGAGYQYLASIVLPGGDAYPEVAYAPLDGDAVSERPHGRVSGFGRRRTHIGALSTPRERIARLREMRAAEMQGSGASRQLRRTLSGVPHAQPAAQRNVRVSVRARAQLEAPAQQAKPVPAYARHGRARASTALAQR